MYYYSVNNQNIENYFFGKQLKSQNRNMLAAINFFVSYQKYLLNKKKNPNKNFFQMTIE